MQLICHRSHLLPMVARASPFVEATLCAGKRSDDQDKQEEMTDVVMMRLRTADGLDLAAFEESYGSSAARSVASALEPHSQAGLVQPRSSAEGSNNAAGMTNASAEQGGRSEEADSSRNGRSMHPDLAMNKQKGLRGKRVRLTDPEGFLVSNDVISDVFAALEP